MSRQGKLSDDQEKERSQLTLQLEQEMEMLLAYQSKVRKMTENHHENETKELKEKVALRQALLDQKVFLLFYQLYFSCYNYYFYFAILLDSCAESQCCITAVVSKLRPAKYSML